MQISTSAVSSPLTAGGPDAPTSDAASSDAGGFSAVLQNLWGTLGQGGGGNTPRLQGLLQGSLRQATALSDAGGAPTAASTDPSPLPENGGLDSGDAWTVLQRLRDALTQAQGGDASTPRLQGLLQGALRQATVLADAGGAPTTASAAPLPETGGLDSGDAWAVLQGLQNALTQVQGGDASTPRLQGLLQGALQQATALADAGDAQAATPRTATEPVPPRDDPATDPAVLEALAGLFALLPPEMQGQVQQWAAGGHALPETVGDGDTLSGVGGGVQGDGRQAIARLLLSAAVPTAAQGSQATDRGRQADGGEGRGSLAAALRMGIRDTTPASTDPDAVPLTEAVGKPADGAQATDLERLLALSAPPHPTPDGSGAASMPPPAAPLSPTARATDASQGAPVTLPAVEVAPGEDAWDRAIGERVVWMVGHQTQSAELHLNPPDLGPVEIRVTLHNDQASVTFTAQHPFTREALEAALPRLRDMMGEANVNLVSVDVGQRDPGEPRGGPGRQPQWTGGPQDGPGGDPGMLTRPLPLRSRSGLVDDFV